MALWLSVVDLSIPVVGGTGSATFATVKSKIRLVAIKHGGVATYDYEIFDSANYGIAGKTGMSGDNSIAQETLCNGSNTFKISNAGADGTYSARIYIEGS